MGRKRKKKKKKKHGTIHHILPQSKGGPRKHWNEATKPQKQHQSFHTLYENELPCQAVDKIELKWTKKSKRLAKSKLSKKQLKAWTTLFGKRALPKTAIDIIKKDWVVKDGSTFKGCFNYKTCFNTNPQKICPILKLYKEGKLSSERRRK